MMASCGSKHISTEKVNDESKIDSLIQLMTLEEKIHMIHASSSFTSGGVERLGIPELVMSDGPHGVRMEHGRDWTPDKTDKDMATYLPTGICLASTWNKNLGYQYGSVLGSEAKARGKDIILGPGVNIIRSPLNGRNFEYLSEDPHLASEMAVGYIKGVQDQGISACVKHYAANNQETERTKVDVIVSERALREIYLPAFKASVEKAGVNAVMGSYNKVNGQYSTHHQHLINQVLKQEFGFDGIVISDWSAVKDTREALLYGTDIEMGTDIVQLPNPDYDAFFLADSALAMVKRGEVDEKVVDEKIRRILRVMLKTSMSGTKSPGQFNTAEHQQTALKVAEEGIVLLKNENLLPFKPNQFKTILVVGNNAVYKQALGGGSSQVKALYEITALEGLKKYAGPNTKVLFAEGYIPTNDLSYDIKLADEAVLAAGKADAVIFVGGWIHNYDQTVWDGTAFDMEGKDKTNLKLIYGQEELINRIAKANPKTTVVLMGGSNVEMKNWMKNVPAILQAWYPGMEGGNALAKIIFGETNPSGKLPMTFANTHNEYPSHAVGEFPGKDLRVSYAEGIYVGYRYFDKQNLEPVYPFGYGLSYTGFSFSNLKLTQKSGQVVVECTVTNTGKMAGAEVAQLYVAPLNPLVDRPVKELKGFEKVYLKPGESAGIKLVLENEAFGYFDEKSHQWKTDTGTYEIQMGNSSRNILLKESISL
ncbi:MAG: glycoside hydrolase family 3 C-terminal domain-containing protein [Bacteroidales bacterium]|nr:glycoside hydrolase family 3 C-terminal domain-containing protein [Bacteroidales bacterium]